MQWMSKFFILLFLPLTLFSQVLKIAIDKDMEPYSYLDSNNNPNGILVDFWKLWSLKTGYEIEFVASSWQGTLQNIKEKKADIHSGLFFNEERNKYMDFIKPIYTSTSKIYIRNQDFQSIVTVDDLSLKKIGMIEGTYFINYFKERYPKVAIKTYKSYKELIQALHKRKVDAFIDDNMISWFQLLKNRSINNTIALSKFQLNKMYYVGVAKDNIILKKQVIEGINQISNNEILDIENKWLVNYKLQFVKPNSRRELSLEQRLWLQDNSKVHLALLKDWNRFSFYKDGKFIGFHLDLIKLINDNLAIQIPYKVYDSWSHAYQSTKEGIAGGILGLSWTKERERFFQYGKPYYRVPMNVVVHKDNKYIKYFNDIKDQNIIIFKDSVSKKMVTSRIKEAKFTELESTQEVLNAMKEKKANVAVFENAKVFDLDLYDLKIIDSIFAKESDLYVGISKRYDMLQEIIDIGLESITKKQFKQLQNKWFSDFKEESMFTKAELDYLRTAPVIKIGSDNWSPMYYKGQNGQLDGVSGDYFKKIADFSGLKFEVIEGQWSDLLTGMKEGKIDILPASFYEKRREAFGLFSSPYFDVRTYLYRKEINSHIRSFEDLKGKRLALTKDDGRVPFIMKNFPEIEIVFTAGLNEAIYKVIDDEVDAFIGMNLVVEDILQRELIQGIKGVFQKEVPVKSVYIMSIKSKPMLASILQKSLDNISKNERQLIVNSWLNRKSIQEVDVGFYHKQEPYIIGQTHLKGIAFDLTEMILDKLGIRINKTKSFSYDKLNDVLLQDNTLDMSVLVKPVHDELFYSQQLMSYKNVVITKKRDNLQINTIKDLKNLNVIGFEGAYKYLGTEYSKLFHPSVNNPNYKEYFYQDKQVNEFILGDTQAIVLDKTIFLWHLKDMFFSSNTDEYNFHNIFGSDNPFYVAFRSKTLRDRFDNILTEMKRSGEYQQLIYNYIFNDIRSKALITELFSLSIASYLFADDVRELQKILSKFASLPYVKKVEILDSDNILLLSSNSEKFENPHTSKVFYFDAFYPKQVGFFKFYFDEELLKQYASESNLVPSLEEFENLRSFPSIKEAYKRMGFLDKKIEFTEEEKAYIARTPILRYSNSHWEPLSIVDKNSLTGILKEYMNIVEEKTGIEFKFVNSSDWMDVIKQFREKSIDIIPGTSNSQNMKILGVQTKEFARFQYAIITNDKGGFSNGLKDLNGETVALVKGHSITSLIQKEYPQINVKLVNSIHEAMSLVSNNSVYAYVDHKAVVGFHMHNYFPHLKIVGLSNEEYRHNILVQRDNKVLLSILNKTLDSISVKAKQDIENKWIKTKVTTVIDYTLVYQILAIFTLILIIAAYFIRKLSKAKDEVEKINQKLNTTLDNLQTTQGKLIESEKMASLGGLVAGVAHEINTPVGIGITGISHFMELSDEIKDNYKKEKMTQEEFENYLNTSNELAHLININLEKTAQLVKSFKQVAVDQTSEEKRVFNVNDYSQEILLSLGNVIKKSNVKIKVLCNNNIRIHSYPGAFSQVLTNLIINSLTHGFKDKKEGNITISFYKQNDDFIKLVYRDNGKGIEKKNLKKIFDPFFTTNREHGGSGLGLNIIYNIVTNNLGGSIVCRSDKGKGVEFTVLISRD